MGFQGYKKNIMLKNKKTKSNNVRHYFSEAKIGKKPVIAAKFKKDIMSTDIFSLKKCINTDKAYICTVFFFILI